MDQTGGKGKAKVLSDDFISFASFFYFVSEYQTQHMDGVAVFIKLTIFCHP